MVLCYHREYLMPSAYDTIAPARKTRRLFWMSPSRVWFQHQKAPQSLHCRTVQNHHNRLDSPDSGIGATILTSQKKKLDFCSSSCF
jgi:hypothetical protein